MDILKLLFIIIIWIVIGGSLTYFQLFTLTIDHLKKIIYLNQKEETFQFFFILYILLSPFILLFSIPSLMIVMITKKIGNKDTLKNDIQETVQNILKVKKNKEHKMKKENVKDKEVDKE